jgi:folate-binding Fe-S cluster repair protein YgfZ
MDEALYQTILSQGAWVDLSARAKWRLSGADRVRYLNGQVTNDVRTARADTALHACVTNLKGMICASMRMATAFCWMRLRICVRRWASGWRNTLSLMMRCWRM